MFERCTRFWWGASWAVKSKKCWLPVQQVDFQKRPMVAQIQHGATPAMFVGCLLVKNPRVFITNLWAATRENVGSRSLNIEWHLDIYIYIYSYIDMYIFIYIHILMFNCFWCSLRPRDWTDLHLNISGLWMVERDVLRVPVCLYFTSLAHSAAPRRNQEIGHLEVASWSSSLQVQYLQDYGWFLVTIIPRIHSRWKALASKRFCQRPPKPSCHLIHFYVIVCNFMQDIAGWICSTRVMREGVYQPWVDVSMLGFSGARLPPCCHGLPWLVARCRPMWLHPGAFLSSWLFPRIVGNICRDPCFGLKVWVFVNSKVSLKSRLAMLSLVFSLIWLI